MSVRHLTKEDLAETKRLREAGLSVEAIGAALGISHVAAYRRLVKLGHQPRRDRVGPNPMQPPRIGPRAHPMVREIALRAHTLGLTQEELVRRAGIGLETLRHWKLGRAPNVVLLDACAEVVGLRLALEQIDDQARLDAGQVAS